MDVTASTADDYLLGMVQAVRYLHVHTEFPIPGNAVTGPGYAPVPVPAAPAGWSLSTVSGPTGPRRRLSNAQPISLPTPGGAWTGGESLGLWDRTNIAVNEANPPLLVRAFPFDDTLMVMVNDSIQIPAGGLRIEVSLG